MRFRDAVLKPSGGRLTLHHLRSAYSVDLNEATLALITRTLVDPGAAQGAGRSLVEKLARAGVLEEGAPDPLPRRDASEVVSLEIEPVGTCNLECAHCFVSFSGQRMSQATFDAVLAGARALGVVELTFNGGEPLLHPDALEWIDAARAAGLRVLLFTNATLVTERIAARLAAAGVGRVTVSLDGFEAEHDAIRGAGAFARAVRGIRRLVAAGLTVFTTTMVHDGNRGSVEALGRWCREALGVHGLRTSVIAPLGRAKTRPALALAPAEVRELFAHEPQGAPSPTNGRLPCRAGVDKLFITAAGDVYPCHLFDTLDAGLGNVGDRPLEAIAGAVAAARCGPVLTRFEPGHLPECRSCPSLASCLGGCRARAWALSGSAWGRDPMACRKWLGVDRFSATA